MRSSHIATEFQFFWKIAHFEVDWQALVFETSSFSNLTLDDLKQELKKADGDDEEGVVVELWIVGAITIRQQ